MSLHEIQRFLFASSNLDLLNERDRLLELNDAIAKLIIDGQQTQSLLSELRSFNNLVRSSSISAANPLTRLRQTNLESALFILASSVQVLSKAVRHEQPNSERQKSYQHALTEVYKTLYELGDTPTAYLSFIHHLRYLKEIDVSKSNQQKPDAASSRDEIKLANCISKPLRHLIHKWINEKEPVELLKLLVKYKRYNLLTNKDLIKLIHIKPKNDGVNLVVKYTLFGFKKIKEELNASSNKELVDFVNDLETLKAIKNSQEASLIILKNKFQLEHIPSKIRRLKECWKVLIQNVDLEHFCENVHIYMRKDVLKRGTESEQFVLRELLNKDSDRVKNINPMHLCLAMQVYEQLTHYMLIRKQQREKANNSEAFNNLVNNMSSLIMAGPNPATATVADAIKEAFWNAFLASVQNNKDEAKSGLASKRILALVEINGHMRNAHTDGLKQLNPIDVSACIILTLHYLSKSGDQSSSLDTFVSTDKIEHIKLNDTNTDLNTIESIFQGYASIDANPNEKIFEHCLSLTSPAKYDAFIVLTSTNQNDQKLANELSKYRAQVNQNARLVIINFSEKVSELNLTDSSQLRHKDREILNLYGWNFDSYFILESFLKERF